MKSRRPALALVLLLALTALLAWLVEFRPDEESSGWTDTAKRNPYLAAGQFIELSGYSVEFRDFYNGAPDKPGVLVLNQPPDSLGAGPQKALLEWVAKGNRLILSAERIEKADPASDFILGPLGVQVHHGSDEASIFRRAIKTAVPGKKPALPWMHLDDEAGDIQADFRADIRLEDPHHQAAAMLEDRGGAIHGLIIARGRGVLTVVSDARWMQSSEIGQGDHAALLRYLLGKPAPGSRVVIVQDGGYPGLFVLLWRHAAQAVLGLTALVLAWAWRSGARFGPLRAGPQQARRSLGEHLLASGRYLWFAGRHDRLYEAMRKGFRQRVFLRHPDWRRLPMDSLLDELHRQSGLSRDVLRSALSDPPQHDLARFLSDMRVMNQLRKLT